METLLKHLTSLIEMCSSSGNYTQALEDFEVCLKLQTKYLEPDSRQLAETNYQMGITYCLTEQYSQAIQHLNNSIEVIKSRLGKACVPLADMEDILVFFFLHWCI